MYWPISSPSVYEQELPIQNRILSYDGVEDGSKSETSTDLLGEKLSHSSIEEQIVKDYSPEPESSQISSNSGSAQSHHQKAKETNQDPWNVVEEQRGPNEEVLGVCNARSSHLFATITRESLSIWQTKVLTQ